MATIINLDEVRRQVRAVMGQQEPRRLDWRTPPSLSPQAQAEYRQELRETLDWYAAYGKRHDKPTDPDAA